MKIKQKFSSLPSSARLAVVVFGIGGACALMWASFNAGPIDRNYFVLLLFLATFTAHSKVRLIGGSSLSLLTTVVLLSLMMLGPQQALLVAAAGVLVQCAIPPRRLIPHHLIFNLGMISLTVWLAGKGYYAVVRDAHPSATEEFVGSLVASLLYYIGNSVCVSLIVALSSRKSVLRLWHDNFLYTAPSFFIAGLLAATASRLVISFPGAALIVVVPFLYLSYYSYRVYLHSLENEKKHAEEMKELFDSTLSTLALAIDAKDRNTHGHILRVQKYSRAIAEAMRLDEDEITAIAAAALLHDIGKLAIPEYILSKTGPLSPEELRKMRLHPQLGADIISNIKFPYPVADSILAHHERFDGSGYPNGLAGKEIPLGARILAVVDYFDAYTSHRTESKEVIEEALETIRQGAGASFDPEIVVVWESICRDTVTLHPATKHSAAYTDIQRATSEIKILDSLAAAIDGLTSVEEVASAVRALLEKTIRGCKATLQIGEHDGVPVMFSGIMIASLSVHRPGEPLTDDERWLVTAVAEKISGSLNNALALEKARQEAIVDKLTGLSNRRAFEKIAESMAGQYFSLVLIDINAFKAVNDNFGHHAGDAALIRISAHLQSAFSDAELICRFGGDEFLVLTFADQRSLRLQIRSFRRKVASDPEHACYKNLLFGVSCGTARVAAGISIQRALQQADERMYAFKMRCKQLAARYLVA